MTKKLLTALLTLTLGLFFFAACAEKTAENGSNGENNENSENPAAPNAPSNTGASAVPENDPGEANYVIISVRDFGEITIQLYPQYAPIAVSRFVENVRSGFYTGRNFHRIVDDFMIQGGSYSGDGVGDPNAETFKPEPHPSMRHFYGALAMAATGAGDASDSFYIVNSKNTSAFGELLPQAPLIEMSVQSMQDELDEIKENREHYDEMYGSFMVDHHIEQSENMISHYTHLANFLSNAADDVIARYAEVGGAPFLDGGYTVFGYTIDGFDVIDAISAVETTWGNDNAMSKPLEEIIIEWIIVKTTLD
jgi:peptidyl-prolyl cis-trans isomerase A (cyclophilin A)/peptidyl-prolyl cis-trans isomerase B (cyclophilin B)